MLKNTGLIYQEKESDLLGGSIPWENRNATSSWLDFLSDPEKQKLLNVDVMACVSFAVNKSIAWQLNWALRNGLLPELAVKFFTDNGYIVNGKFNCSDRFLAKVSKTTPQGNTLQGVLDALRKYGIVPESKWPNDPKFSWNEYYIEPTDEVFKLGLESLKFIDVLYERLTDLSVKNLDKQLQHAPIVIGTATCQPWDAQVNFCSEQANHATTLADIESKTYVISDQYEPFIKRLLPGFKIWFAYKAVLFPKVSTEAPLDPESLFSDIKYGDSGEKVIKLKKALTRLGWFSDGSEVYDEALAKVVFDYQLANLPWSSWSRFRVVYYRSMGEYDKSIVDKATRDTINYGLLFRK